LAGTREHVAALSSPIVDDRIAQLRGLFPEARGEAGVDWDRLRAALGTSLDERPDRYRFEWAGKRDAISLLQRASSGTLVPLPEESVDGDLTQQFFIEGENLEVLKLLYKPYAGRVKMIYIDPPYNTGNEQIYRDDYSRPLEAYLEQAGLRDARPVDARDEGERGTHAGRVHSDWLSMMYPRLFLARQLLRDDGLIFVSIDDHEVYHLRMLMNEVFGEENFIESFIWKKSYGGGAKERFAVTQHEYILLYARNRELVSDLWLPPDEEGEERYDKRDEKFHQRGPYRLKPLEATKSMDRRENLIYPIPLPDGGEVRPKRQWWWSRERTMKALADGEIVFTRTKKGVSVSYKQYLIDETGEKRGAKPFSIIDGIYTQHGTEDLAQLFDGKVPFQFPKPVALLRLLLQIGTGPRGDDLVLDFFAGSGTTGQAVLELNRADGGRRRCVLIQMPERLATAFDAGGKPLETLSQVGRERVRRSAARLRKDTTSQIPMGESGPEDLGLACFRLEESRLHEWVPVDTADAERYLQSLELFRDPLKRGAAVREVIHEIALKEAGYGLNCRIEQVDAVRTNAVHRVRDPDRDLHFHICLDEHLDPETPKALGLHGGQDLFVCRDVALDDTLAANLALQCRLRTI
jgi:adenine-specific DNA-methyltransferase